MLLIQRCIQYQPVIKRHINPNLASPPTRRSRQTSHHDAIPEPQLAPQFIISLHFSHSLYSSSISLCTPRGLHRRMRQRPRPIPHPPPRRDLLPLFHRRQDSCAHRTNHHRAMDIQGRCAATRLIHQPTRESRPLGKLESSSNRTTNTG